MIHEFQRIVPVETPVGYGSLLYVDGIDCPCRIQYGVDNGGMENDYITVAREDNGKWLTARIDQIRSAPNPTLDIEESSDA